MSKTAAAVIIRRTPSELSDEELSQELYNLAAVLGPECEQDEPSLEFVALVLSRMQAVVEELADDDLETLMSKASDDDLAAFDATEPKLGLEVPEEVDA